MYTGQSFNIPLIGGWNNNPNLDQVDSTQMIDVDNINIENNGRVPRGGSEKVNTTAITDSPQVTGVYQFSKEGESREYLVDENGDNIGDENGNILSVSYLFLLTGTNNGKIQNNFSNEIKTGLANNRRYHFETFYNQCFICNGVDIPQVWDGNNDTTWDLGSPKKPVAVLGSGAGNVNDGEHSYKITFVTESGESTGSKVSEVVTVVDSAINGKIDLSSIEIGPEGTTARKIYRTEAGDTGDYKLVGTISDNTTTIYEDNIADASLTDVIPTTSLAFLPSSWIDNYPEYMVIHGRGVSKRLFAFGCKKNPNYIYASKNGVADFSDENIVAIKLLCDKITSLQDFADNLLISSWDKYFILDDTDLNVVNWGYYGTPWEGGCANQNLTVRTPTDVVSMSEENNIYSIVTTQNYGDYEIASLSKPFFIDIWVKNNIDLKQIDKFHAIYDPELRAIKIFCVRKEKNYPNVALVFFIDSKQWVKHSYNFNILSSTKVRLDSSEWAIYVGSDDGFVYRLESEILLDGESIYESNFKTTPLYITNSRSYKIIDKIWLVINPKGTETINGNVEIDGVDLENTYSITSTGEENILKNYGFNIGAKGNRASIKISNNDGNDYFIGQMIIDFRELGAF